MALARYILLAALPGLMFCIIPAAGGTDACFSWQIVAIWLAGVVLCLWLRSWWFRIFFLLALAQVIAHGPVITAYISLLMIGIFLAAIQGFASLDPENIMDMLCLAALLLIGWMILQAEGIVGTGGLGMSAAGPFNIDAGSCFLAMCLPAFWRPRRWYGLLPVVGGIFACHSTTGFLAAAAAMIMIAVIRMGFRGRIICGLGLLLAALVFFRWYDPAGDIRNNPRWPAWQRVIQSYQCAPLGRGLNSFGDIFPLLTASDNRLHQNDGQKITGPTWQHAHNDYLEIGFELGLHTLALLMAYLAWIFKHGAKSREQGAAFPGIAAAAVGAAGFHIFHIAPTALVGCAWLGMWHGQRKAVG